jgi:hypothetical protein
VVGGRRRIRKSIFTRFNIIDVVSFFILPTHSFTSLEKNQHKTSKKKRRELKSLRYRVKVQRTREEKLVFSATKRAYGANDNSTRIEIPRKEGASRV